MNGDLESVPGCFGCYGAPMAPNGPCSACPSRALCKHTTANTVPKKAVDDLIKKIGLILRSGGNGFKPLTPWSD